MYQEIMIGGKAVPMLAMASVDVYYKNIFHEDPVKAQLTENTEDLVSFVQKMGFVMAKFAELKDRKEMAKLNEDSYLDWMDGFERMDYMNALPEIRMVYENQKIPSSKEKKRADE